MEGNTSFCARERSFGRDSQNVGAIEAVDLFNDIVRVADDSAVAINLLRSSICKGRG